MHSRAVMVCLLLLLPIAASGQSSETNPNTSNCYRLPDGTLPMWCDITYINNNNGTYPGWNDNEPRTNMDPIRTKTINIAPGNVSKLPVHQLLPPMQQDHTLAFVSLQMWFSAPADSQTTIDNLVFDRAGGGSHLMNGAIDCPTRVQDGNCAVNQDPTSQQRWDAAVADISGRGFDGTVAITQGGHNTCLNHADPVTLVFTQGSTFDAQCANGSNQYRPAAATLLILHSMQNANNGAFTGMRMAWMEDDGAWKNASQCGSSATTGWKNDTTNQRAFQVICVQTKLRADYAWANTNIFSAPQGYKNNGHPVTLIFDDLSAPMFLDPSSTATNIVELCTATADHPNGTCQLLDGSFCKSKVDCWNQIWSQHKTFINNTFGTATAPLLLFRNFEGFTRTQSDGAFLWLAFNDAGETGSQHPNRSDITTLTQGEWQGVDTIAGCPGETTTVGCFYSLAKSTPGKFVMGGAYKGFDPRYATWYFPHNPVLSQLCGMTWVNTWQAHQNYFDSTRQLSAMVANTWDDYEEGSEIQTGIDNCFTTHAFSDPNQTNLLRWENLAVNGNTDAVEDTIAQYEIFQDTPTMTFGRIATIDRNDPRFASKQFNVAPFISNPPNWFFVQARGKPTITDHLSSNVDFWPSWGSVTIDGAEGSYTVDPCSDIEPPAGQPPPSCPQTYYDRGSVSITVNGFTKTVSYGSWSTPSSIASDLASAFNADSNSPVTAQVEGGSEVYFTTKLAGRNTNYSLSVTSSTSDPADFGGPSFYGTSSGPTMTGGVG